MGYAVTLLVGAGLLTLGVLFYVGQVGKPRKPVSPSDAVAVVILDTVIIVAMALAAVHLLH